MLFAYYNEIIQINNKNKLLKNSVYWLINTLVPDVMIFLQD